MRTRPCTAPSRRSVRWQETVRHFFRAGGASQTIAKAMSAYDKDFSNAIYGAEPGNRFVCESRLMNMLAA
jgi:hypothetical protein